jgi:hypothetical protein
VCGKYVPVRTGIPHGDPGERKFRHENCRDAALGLNRPPPRREARAGVLAGLGDRIANLPHPGLAGVAGAVAVLFGVVLLFVAGGDEKGANPVRPAEVSDTRPEVDVLGETETVDEVDDPSTTTAGEDEPATTEASAPVVPGAPITTQRRTTTTRPGVSPPPAPPSNPGSSPSPTTAAPTTTGAPGTTSRPATTTTRPATTTTRPPTTTTRPPTTTSPPTTTTSPPTTTTSPPTTTTDAPTTTTTAPPTTTTVVEEEPPPDIVDVLLDILT